VDAVVNSLPNLAPLVKERPETFAIGLPPFGPATYFAWVGRKDEDSASLVKFISDGIVRLNKNGRMAELQKKWFGFTMDVPADEFRPPTSNGLTPQGEICLILASYWLNTRSCSRGRGRHCRSR
jgi:polar amino acid transport system substrate-binding protein